MKKSFSKYAVFISALLYELEKLEFTIQSELRIRDILFSRNSISSLKQEIINLIESDNAVSAIIKNADTLSKASNKIASTDTIYYSSLVSIFSKIQLNKKTDSNDFGYLPHKLDLEHIFPQNLVNQPTIGNSKLKECYQEFLKELNTLHDSGVDAFLNSVLFLLEKYFCYVSSESNEKGEVSLFDHIKTVVALSLCINDSENTDYPFIIVASDLNGIQNFIYNDFLIQGGESGGKSKRLRGKSFYLNLLNRTITSYIVKTLALFRSNVLLDGGGNFILIVPNNESNKNKLQQIRKVITDWIFNTYRGQLNTVLVWLETDNSLYTNYPKWHNEITSKLQAAKKKKNSDSLEEIFYKDLDEYLPLSSDEEFLKSVKGIDNRFEQYQLTLSKIFEFLGQTIPYSKYLIEIHSDMEDELPKLNDNIYINFSELGIHWLFVNEKELKTFLSSSASFKPSSIDILSINNTNFNNNIPDNFRNVTSTGFLFIGKYAPQKKDGGLLDYSEIACLNNEIDGKTENLDYPLFAILRMDVDNLGAIFSFGLERDREIDSIKTLSRVVNLSRDLNLFFLGYLNTIAEKRNIYITYSGGDDLFVVGSWINVIHFALDVKKDFAKFVCNNPNITISAGIFLCKSHFPIGKAAAIAGEKEKRAKDKFLFEKDCISIFDKEIHWEDFEEYINYGKELNGLIKTGEDDEIKPSYIHFLLGLSLEMFNEDEKISDFEKYFKNLARIKYSFSRRNISAKALEAVETKKDINKKVIVLSRLITHKDAQSYLRNFIIPASYVILKNRKPKE